MLLPIISQIFWLGTIIESNKWRRYPNISRDLRVVHNKVNHSINFVNQIDITHTQNTKSCWSKQKLKNKKIKGISRDKLLEYLIEFM